MLHLLSINLVIASSVEGRSSAVVAPFQSVLFKAYIPNYELRTRDSGVLPKETFLQGGCCSKFYRQCGYCSPTDWRYGQSRPSVEGDLFHERYRQELVREFATIKNCQENGAYAAFHLSGAGPTVIAGLG